MRASWLHLLRRNDQANKRVLLNDLSQVKDLGLLGALVHVHGMILVTFSLVVVNTKWQVQCKKKEVRKKQLKYRISLLFSVTKPPFSLKLLSKLSNLTHRKIRRSKRKKSFFA
jgi:hypothetical protein